jgi:hypothetical protein
LPIRPLYCIFVLAMEPAVVAAHIEVAYKDLAENLRSGRRHGDRPMLGWQFLEKIVQLPLSLPPPDAKAQVPGYAVALLGGAASPATRTTELQRPPSPDGEGTSSLGAEPTAHASALTAPAAGGDSADTASALAAEASAGLTRQLESAIRRRSPTVESLSEVARQAQDEVLGAGARQLRQETITAANRVLVEIYSDTEARTAILGGVPEIEAGNPRQIKRFVNLFRFYTFVAQQHRLQGRSAPVGNAIAKLAVLAIRWPHLLHTFGAPTRSGGSILLELECRARESAADGAPPEATKVWQNAVIDAGLVPDKDQWPAHQGWTEQLRRFLAREPAIAADAVHLL